MTTNEYPLIKNLENIKSTPNLDFETKINKIKAVLLDEVIHRKDAGIEKEKSPLFITNFEAVNSVFGPDKNSVTTEFSKIELEEKLKRLLQFNHKSISITQMSITENLLMIYLDNHKFYLGNDFFEVIYDVFGKDADNLIEVMYDRIRLDIIHTMGRNFFHDATESSKKISADFYINKYKNTYFETMVIQLTNFFISKTEFSDISQLILENNHH